MNKTNFIRGVAAACQVVFSILKVLCILGAVAIFLGIASLSFLPKNAVVLNTSSQVSMDFDIRSLAGDAFDQVKDSLVGQDQDGVEETENGFRIRQDAATLTAENRSLALSIIPAFAKMIILFFFYRYLSLVAASIKDASVSPFTPKAAKELKNAGIALFFLSAAPALCSTLIGILTHGMASSILGENSLDFEMVLWGFVLFALSYLFEYGALLSASPVSNQEN